MFSKEVEVETLNFTISRENLAKENREFKQAFRRNLKKKIVYRNDIRRVIGSKWPAFLVKKS